MVKGMEELKMEDEYTKGLGDKLVNFMAKFEQWNSIHFDKQFNKNGRSEFKLTHRKYSILFSMQKLNISTVSEFERIISISKSSLSLTLSKLVEEGFISKHEPLATDDGRKAYFRITPKGIEEYNKACETLDEMFKQFYDSLSASQKIDLKEGIERLNNVF
jgi:DNA-binding MarR family transcriptional regulator